MPPPRGTAAQRFESLGRLLMPVDPGDAMWAWVIQRASDPRAPLLWLAGIGGVAALGYSFLTGQGDALDFYPALSVVRRVLGAVVLLALLILAGMLWLAFRLRMAATHHHEAANALYLRAETAPPAQRRALLDGALAGWRAALVACPRNLAPGAWATTQLCLARAAAQRAQLDTPGVASAAPGADPLLDEAATGYRVALQAHAPQAYMPGGASPAASPMWIAAQRELALTLRAQAERTPTPERAMRYADAAAPYRAILAATPFAASPRAWADTQIALADALATAAEWAASPDGPRLLAEAAAGYRAAGEVYARHATEREWASVWRTLGDTLRRAASLADSTAPARLLDEALAAYQAAQTVLTRWVSPGDWSALQLVSGQALRERAALEPDGPAREGRLRAAVDALDGALAVCTPEGQPREWAASQFALGETLADLARMRPMPERAQLVAEAVAALDAAQHAYVESGDTDRAERARAALVSARAEAEGGHAPGSDETHLRMDRVRRQDATP
jgi:hypothetical protein